LVVLTHRPEFAWRWSHYGHVTALTLNKLTRAQSAAMVSRLAGGKALPADLLEQILAKTDGVPLFLEELTRSLLESGDLREGQRRRQIAVRLLHIDDLFVTSPSIISPACPAGRRWGTDGLHDSPLEGDGFELLVPRHESPRFPAHSSRSLSP
jgi:hypothetical protein